MVTSDSFKPIHQNVKLSLQPVSEPRSPGTFLIPSIYAEKMLIRMNDLGFRSVSIYLRYMLAMYKMSAFQDNFSRSKKVKTEYQCKGLDLVRVSVRPSNTDWLVLSQISFGLGYSRCYVFVMLLELDLGIMDSIDVVPTPRHNRDHGDIKYAIALLHIIYPGSNRYERKLRIYELSRLRNPLIRENPGLFNLDGSFILRQRDQ